jgi:hypothetical protein
MSRRAQSAYRGGGECLGVSVDATTLEFLRRLQEQQRGNKTHDVYAGDVAYEMNIAPGRDEYVRIVGELVAAGYLIPDPKPTRREYGLYQITDAGISAAES